MITLKPIEYDKKRFIKDLVEEVIFMTKHYPDDKLEIVMNICTYSNIKDIVDIKISKALADGDINASSLFNIPIRVDNTIPENKADVVLKK